MHACVIPQLLGELKPIGSLSASQLSCNSVGLTQPQMALVDYERPSRAQSTEALRFFFQWRIYSALAQILRRSCFTQGNPVPGVQCPECNSKVEPNRIPFQNGCLFCKDMGLNMCACICSLCFLAWVPGLKLISYLFVSWLDSLINY